MGGHPSSRQTAPATGTSTLPRRRGGLGRRVSALIGGWAIAVLLTACGPGGDDDPPPVATAPTDMLSIVTPTPGTPPPRAAVPAPAVGQQTYVVREGDSLSLIAERFGVTQDAIQRANDITDPNSLFAGQEIVIPAPEP